MLRFYIRPFTWGINHLNSVRATRNQFCSTVNESDEIKQSKRNWRATKACDAIIAIGDLKRDAKIAPSDLQEDDRFKSLLKTLESDHIRKVEPLKLISSLKVNLHECLFNYYV